jgi:hypothetical protein
MLALRVSGLEQGPAGLADVEQAADAVMSEVHGPGRDSLDPFRRVVHGCERSLRTAICAQAVSRSHRLVDGLSGFEDSQQACVFEWSGEPRARIPVSAEYVAGQQDRNLVEERQQVLDGRP